MVRREMLDAYWTRDRVSMCSQRNKLKRSPLLRYHSINISSVYTACTYYNSTYNFSANSTFPSFFLNAQFPLLFRSNSSSFLFCRSSITVDLTLTVFSFWIDSILTRDQTIERHPKVSQFLRIDIKNSSFPWNILFLLFLARRGICSHVSLCIFMDQTFRDLISRFEAAKLFFFNWSGLPLQYFSRR